MKRGEVWLVNDGAALSSDVRAARLCMIVAPDMLAEHLGTVLAVPLLRDGRTVSFRPPVKVRDIEGALALDQVQAVLKSHFVRRQGAVDRKTLAASLAVLRELFAE